MLFLRKGFSGTISGERYSTHSISLPLGRGNKAFNKLITKSGCSPNIFLKVKSAFGSKYLSIVSFF